MTDLDAALDEIARLRTAIRQHRDAVCNNERAEWPYAIDIELWLAIKEK